MYKIGLCALSILTLVACGKDICKRSAGYAEDCDDEFSDADLDECHDMISECSKSDEKALNGYFDCLEDAGFMECDPSSEELDSSLDAIFSCLTDLDSMSDECLQSFAGGTSTNTYTYSSSSTSGS